MKKTIYFVFIVASTLACTWICRNYLFRPTMEELTKFIGKTEEELRKKFGSPDIEETIDLGPPFGYDEDQLNEWCEQNVWRILIYRSLHVRINFHDKVMDINSKSSFDNMWSRWKLPE